MQGNNTVLNQNALDFKILLPLMHVINASHWNKFCVGVIVSHFERFQCFTVLHNDNMQFQEAVNWGTRPVLRVVLVS